jgi:hypothetical protein
VARDDDGERVGAIGEADGAGGVGVAEAGGEGAVGGGFGVGDFAEEGPDLRLERGALGVERDGEVLAGAGEVGLELFGGLGEFAGRERVADEFAAGLIGEEDF